VNLAHNKFKVAHTPNSSFTQSPAIRAYWPSPPQRPSPPPFACSSTWEFGDVPEPSRVDISRGDLHLARVMANVLLRQFCPEKAVPDPGSKNKSAVVASLRNVVEDFLEEMEVLEWLEATPIELAACAANFRCSLLRWIGTEATNEVESLAILYDGQAIEGPTALDKVRGICPEVAVEVPASREVAHMATPAPVVVDSVEEHAVEPPCHTTLKNRVLDAVKCVIQWGAPIYGVVVVAAGRVRRWLRAFLF